MKPLAVTMGDPCGIGPEICCKLFMQALPRPAFVVGDVGVLGRTAASLGLDLAVRAIAAPGEARAEAGALDVLPVTDLAADLPVGRIDARAGHAAYDYVVAAIGQAKAGTVDAIVTAPLAKEAMKAAGIAYPGHTEILAAETGTQDFAMMLANDELRTVLVSIHVSLAEAIALVRRARVLKTIRLAERACRAFGIERPRVAIAGLNPHAGENGAMGRQDEEIVRPAVEALIAEGIDARGPLPADTMFHPRARATYDAAICMYHDQALIPAKALAFDETVNVTLGLPFIRTSPDHGTAFDIAGRGVARPDSLIAALKMARAMADSNGAAR